MKTVAIFALFIVASQAQFFGGINRLPGGGSHQSAGFQAGPAWGSVSKTVDSRGFASPNTFSLGAGHTTGNLHGISGSASHTPGFGGSSSIRGQVGVVNTPNHQVTGWAQHQRNHDRNFNFVGRETNSAGLNYNHGNGAGAFLSGSRTPGSPAVGTIGGNVPIFTGKNGRIDAVGQTSFGHGMKPDHQVGIQGSLNF